MIIFSRHGETVSGSEGRFEGFSDSSLTEKGKNQAILLGEYFNDKKPSKILVSPRGRTLATAQIIAGVLKIDFEIDERLIEICYGSWETRKREEFKNSLLWKKREEDFFHFHHPGFYKNFPGESYEELYKRLVPVFSELESLSQSILIVAHSGVLRCARKYFENIDDETFKNSKFSNSVFYSVEITRRGNVSRLVDVTDKKTASI